MFNPKLFWESAKTAASTMKGSAASHGLKNVGKRLAIPATTGAAARNVGRGYMYGTAAAIPIGVGAAIASEHPMQGLVNNIQDVAWGDPALEDQGIMGRDIDNRVLGHDMTFGDMFLPTALNPKRWSAGPIPSFGAVKDALNMENLRNTVSWDKNALKTSNKAYSMSERQHDIVRQRGGGDNEYYDEMMGIPYLPPTRKGPVYASGDQVLGMYNRRHR